jgi:hypothetical protein
MLRIAADHEPVETSGTETFGASNSKEGKQQPLMNGGTVMSHEP